MFLSIHDIQDFFGRNILVADCCRKLSQNIECCLTRTHQNFIRFHEFHTFQDWLFASDDRYTDAPVSSLKNTSPTSADDPITATTTQHEYVVFEVNSPKNCCSLTLTSFGSLTLTSFVIFASHIFAKCPLFLHLKHSASFAGHCCTG